MILLDFLPFAIALAVAAAIPGPSVAACIAKALKAGFKPALPFSIGLAMGDLVYLSLAVFGLATIAATFNGVFLVIKYAGAAYLLYLAWTFWTQEPEPLDVSTSPRGQGWKALTAGFFVTLGNPKTMIFYMALVPTVLDLNRITVADFSILAVIVMLVVPLVMLPYIFSAARARAFFRT
ncbi:MAG: LysE family translocator, partial [Rhodospirillaceae bacterium]